MIECVEKVLAKKKINTLEQFLAFARKEKCTTIILKAECYQEESVVGFSKKTVVVFRVHCFADNNGKEIVQYVQPILTYSPQWASKKQITQELRMFKKESRAYVQTMQKKIQGEFPFFKVRRRS